MELVREYIKKECIFGCFSQETGESGTPHLQGYHHYENARSYPVKAFRELLGNRVHDEIAFGSPRQNRNYCAGLVEKKGNVLNATFWEFGELPSQGARTDWDKAVHDVKNHGVAATLEEQPHLLPCIGALQRFRQISQRSTHRDVRVYVLVGETGTGKSRSAWDAFPDLYSKPAGQWWDGYDAHEVVLLDDYNGEIELSTFLKWLDRYPLQLPVKGGFVAAAYTKVIITSNYTPEQWYRYDGEKHRLALRRRFYTYLEKTVYTQQDLEDHNPNANEEENP